jgi:6-phosphogluconolactonase (cycloisomerase 2 family)
MRTRFTWIVAILALVAVGVLVACSTKYSSSSNGLVVVPTQGDAVMQTFSINLSNGHVSQINNVNGPPTPGVPASVILDPTGTFAYVASTVTCTPPNLAANTSLSAVQGAILTYKVDSDGKLSTNGSAQYLTGNPSYPNTFPTCGLDDTTNPNAGNPITAITMDSAGKFLFVATAQVSATYTTNLDTTPTPTVATLNSAGVAVYAIGSNASLTQVAGSPFALPVQLGGQTPSASALAVTPTFYPELYAYCSGFTPPTTENLYVTDSINNMLLNYKVDPSAGTLILQEVSTSVPGVPTGSIPSGVAVDPCNRFVYVSNAGPGSSPNSVSAYTICSVVTQSCQNADYSLQEVTGSPYPVGDAPGPLAVDAYGNFLYVVDTGSSQLSPFRISQSNGKLTALNPPVVATNLGANSIAIRSDDSWLFVANFGAATVSQYAIIPATGALAAQSPITTFNQPSGVAVK